MTAENALNATLKTMQCAFFLDLCGSISGYYTSVEINGTDLSITTCNSLKNNIMGEDVLFLLLHKVQCSHVCTYIINTLLFMAKGKYNTIEQKNLAGILIWLNGDLSKIKRPPLR